MGKRIKRRSFISRSMLAGLYPFFEIIIRKGSIKDIFTTGPVFLQKTDPGIWSVKKEVYAPSPEPRTGISLSMNYIGNGLKREETRAIIRSSDWTEKPRRRISEDNGRTWSDWVIIDEGSKVQGDFTLSGGEDQEEPVLMILFPEDLSNLFFKGSLKESRR